MGETATAVKQWDCRCWMLADIGLLGYGLVGEDMGHHMAWLDATMDRKEVTGMIMLQLVAKEMLPCPSCELNIPSL